MHADEKKGLMISPLAYRARTATIKAAKLAPKVKVFWAPLPVDTIVDGVAVAERFPAAVLETERVPVGMGIVE